MNIMNAKRHLCPTGAGIPIPPVARKELRLPDGDRFCAADGCMAWRWLPGHDQPDEEKIVWYTRPNSELYTLANETLDDDGDDPCEVNELIRECQAKIKQYIMDRWIPIPPAGAGWRLVEKRWLDENPVPHAIFRRERVNREGYCGVVKEDLNSRDAW
ncbi:MAG: hypothetical protein KDC18_19365 [Alphaproteobacteria bacterium]|nr:hypothetical protein [Alphaproteobacteria bacterium]